MPSVTDRFLEAFVFENETHDLFGVDAQGIAIDFGGNFYALAQKEPMTIISPEQKAAREKAKKVAAAKALRRRRPRTWRPSANAAYVETHPRPADLTTPGRRGSRIAAGRGRRSGRRRLRAGGRREGRELDPEKAAIAAKAKKAAAEAGKEGE